MYTNTKHLSKKYLKNVHFFGKYHYYFFVRKEAPPEGLLSNRSRASHGLSHLSNVSPGQTRILQPTCGMCQAYFQNQTN